MFLNTLFTKLSKYASSLVSNPRDEMNRFVKGVSNDLMEDCRTAMLHDNMSISRLMLHAQQVEESRLKMKNRGFKREKAYEGDTSKRKLEIKDKPKFKKRFSNKVPSKFPKDRVSKP